MNLQEIYLFSLYRLKSLILHNLYLIQPFAENSMYNSNKNDRYLFFILVYSIEHLRSIWLEDCLNIHFLLSVIDKQHLKVLYLSLHQQFYIYILLQNVILRRSTCDRAILTSFFDQLDSLHYLDIASLQSNTFSILVLYTSIFSS